MTSLYVTNIIFSIDEASVWDMIDAAGVSGDSIGLPEGTNLKDWILDLLQNKIEWDNVSNH